MSTFDSLQHANLQERPPDGYRAYQRDSLTDAERAVMDPAVEKAGGKIEKRVSYAPGIRANMPRRRRETSHYLLREGLGP
jgi:hypothetical protein